MEGCLFGIREQGSFDVNNDLFSDTEVNVAKKLFFSFRIGPEGAVKTLEYTEGDTVLLEEVMDEIVSHASTPPLSVEERKERDDKAKADNETAAWMLLYRCNVTDDAALDMGGVPEASPGPPCSITLVAVLDTVEDQDCAALRFTPARLLDTTFLCNGGQLVVQQGTHTHTHTHPTPTLQYAAPIHPVNAFPYQYTLPIHPTNSHTLHYTLSTIHPYVSSDHPLLLLATQHKNNP